MRDAVLAAILGHQAGIGLQHRIHRRPLGERPGLAEARDRDVEDARLARRHGFVVEAQALDDARPEAFEEDVGALQQPPHAPALPASVLRSTAMLRLPRLPMIEKAEWLP